MVTGVEAGREKLHKHAASRGWISELRSAVPPKELPRDICKPGRCRRAKKAQGLTGWIGRGINPQIRESRGIAFSEGKVVIRMKEKDNYLITIGC